jgi:very-short-patch-repair endonuclease
MAALLACGPAAVLSHESAAALWGVRRPALERAVNEADRLDLIDPEALRAALENFSPLPAVRRLRELLDRQTFRLTDSELERLLLRIARRAGLGAPATGVWLNRFKVDFYWSDLGLAVETDGLRYHRTAAQQERDRVRDQAHISAGLTPLRFTHGQVRFEPLHVETTMRDVANRSQRSRGRGPTKRSIDRLGVVPMSFGQS